MSRAIGVIGCGWLGLPLAIELVKKGYEVRGTTSTPSKLSMLEKKGILPFEIILRPGQIEGPIEELLDNLRTLIINVPPGMRRDPNESYLDKMRALHSEIRLSKVDQLIFVSSTSVYGNIEGEVDENSDIQPITESAKQLVAAENLFMNDKDLQVSIIRFGGLIGPDRHPVTRLSGKEDLSNGDDAVNLIHRNDCIHMILTLLENNWWNEIFNGVYPDHPTKADYYREEAVKRGVKEPGYKGLTGHKKGKIIISRNFLNKNQSFFTSIRS